MKILVLPWMALATAVCSAQSILEAVPAVREYHGFRIVISVENKEIPTATWVWERDGDPLHLSFRVTRFESPQKAIEAGAETLASANGRRGDGSFSGRKIGDHDWSSALRPDGWVSGSGRFIPVKGNYLIVVGVTALVPQKDALAETKPISPVDLRLVEDIAKTTLERMVKMNFRATGSASS